jgi:hypothetical protein
MKIIVTLTPVLVAEPVDDLRNWIESVKLNKVTEAFQRGCGPPWQPTSMTVNLSASSLLSTTHFVKGGLV